MELDCSRLPPECLVQELSALLAGDRIALSDDALLSLGSLDGLLRSAWRGLASLKGAGRSGELSPRFELPYGLPPTAEDYENGVRVAEALQSSNPGARLFCERQLAAVDALKPDGTLELVSAERFRCLAHELVPFATRLTHGGRPGSGDVAFSDAA